MVQKCVKYVLQKTAAKCSCAQLVVLPSSDAGDLGLNQALPISLFISLLDPIQGYITYSPLFSNIKCCNFIQIYFKYFSSFFAVNHSFDLVRDRTGNVICRVQSFDYFRN